MRSYSDLPEDITVDILSRLPANSVGHCRCVSKTWRALLSHPKFIRTHLHFSRLLPRHSLLLYSYKDRSFFSASLSNAHQLFDKITIPATRLSLPSHPYSWRWVSDSFDDGLVLVQDTECNTFLLNPITKHIRELPPLPCDLHTANERCFGFGYDSVNCDYKVVTLILHPRGSVAISFSIYSLKRGSWETHSSCYPYFSGCFASRVFLNGCIHWIVHRKRDSMPVILAFDVVEENFRELPFPSYENGATARAFRFTFSKFADFDGCLWVFSEGESRNVTDVWMMKEYGVKESWTKVASIPTRVGGIHPLCLLGKDQMVLLSVYSNLRLYNLKEGTFKDTVVDGIPQPGFYDCYKPIRFVESLISPHPQSNEVGRE